MRTKKETGVPSPHPLPMPLKLWKYEEVDVRDDVKTALPDHAELKLYKTVSGDSGKTYYIQYLVITMHKYDPENTQYIYLCNCPEGTFRAPLEILGAGRGCKHIEHLAEFLKEKRR